MGLPPLRDETEKGFLFYVFAQDPTRSGAHDAVALGAAGRTEISEDELAWLLKYGPHKPILSEHPVDPVQFFSDFLCGSRDRRERA